MPDRPGHRWDRRDTASCLALASVFVLTRALWIATLPASSQYWEEGYRWLAAERLAAGAPLPWLALQADHYQGGSLVVILAAAGLASLGIPSFAALKAVAVGFSTATCLTLFALCRVFFGRGVGLLAGTLYLLGPPLVAFWGVVGMGFHAESVLPSLAGIGVCLHLASGQRRSPAAWLLLGALSGLAVWFSPTAAIAVAACVVTWPWIAERPRRGELAFLAAGLCVGLAPWLAYNGATGFAGARRIFEVFGLAASTDPWRSQGVLARAGDLVLRGPVQGLLDPGGSGAGTGWLQALALGVWLPAGLALVAAGRRGWATLRGGRRHAAPEARSELVFLVYGVLFAAVYLFSRFTLSVDPSPIQFRLLVPPAVLLIPPVAISADRALRTALPWRRLAQVACGLGLLALTTASVRFALVHEEPGTPLSLERGTVAWGHILVRKHGRDVVGAVAELDGLPATSREQVLIGVGWGLQSAWERSGELADLDAALAPLADDDRRTVVRGIRYWSGERSAHLRQVVDRTGDPDEARALARLAALDAWLQPPSVVVVTLDTTRADHLSCYGYARNTTPHLDAFARRAVRFDRAWSTTSWTLPAHASLFTGEYPSRHGADYDAHGGAVLGDVIGLPVARFVRAGRLGDDATTLAELLAAQGYRTGAFVAGPWLHRSFGLLQGFEHKDDAVTGFGGRPAAEIRAAALAWLRTVPTDRPYFLFVNFFDPHAPYEPAGRYPDFPRAGEKLDYDYGALMRGTEVLDPDQRAILRDRYDSEIRDMDQELGRLLDAVLARRGGERTLIVVTADHGEALGDDGRLGHGFWLSEEQTRIPLLVRYPGDRDAGSHSDAPIQLVDVTKLLADELGLSLPKGAEGVAPGQRDVAFFELQPEETTALRFGSAYAHAQQAAVRWPHKLVRSDDGRETLLRLSDGTPSEEPEVDAEAQAELDRRLDAHLAGRRRGEAVAPQADPETIEALRALGYIQ